MTSGVIDLKDSNFDKTIAKGNWAVDYWAEWCGPCKVFTPVFLEVAKQFKGKVNFAKVDVDAETKIANKYEIMSIPTLILFKDGEIVYQFSGAVDEDELAQIIRENYE